MNGNELEAKAAGLGEMGRALAKAATHVNDRDAYETLARRMGWSDGMSPLEVFRKGDESYRAVAALSGRDNAATARRLWERNLEKPLGGLFGAARPPHRGDAAKSLYMMANVDLLAAFMAGVADGVTADSYVDGLEAMKAGGPAPFAIYLERLVPALTALELDEGREADALLGRIGKLFNEPGGWNGGLLLDGLCASRRDDAHALVEKLLLGAGLQDSLRGTIMRNCARGSGKCFLRLYRTALDNDLFRYSSVAGAFLEWTGVGGVDATGAKKRAEGAFADGYACLVDKKKCAAFLTGSENPVRCHLALWALAYNESVDAMAAAALKILAKGPRQLKLPVLRLVGALRIASLSARALEPVLDSAEDRADNALMAQAAGMPPRFPRRKLSAKPLLFPFGDQSDQLSTTPENLRKLYAGFRKVALRLTGGVPDGKPADPDLLERVLSAMIALTRRETPRGRDNSEGAYLNTEASANGFRIVDLYGKTARKWGIHLGYRGVSVAYRRVPDELDAAPPGDNLREDLCSFAGNMRTEQRYDFLGGIVRDGGGGPAGRATLLRFFGARGRNVSAMAGQYLYGLKLTGDERGLVESFLKSKDGAVRQNVFLRLLTEEPEELGRAIGCLLASKDAQQRSAGRELLDILSCRADDPDYKHVYETARNAPSDTPAEAKAKKAAVKKAAARKSLPGPRPAAPETSAAPTGTPAVGKAPSKAPSELPVDRSLGLYDPAQPRVSLEPAGLPDIAAKDAGATIFPVTEKQFSDFYENMAAAVGMQNLARNAGYENTTRFTWKMENAIASTRDTFARRRLGGEAGGVEAWLEADAEGRIDIRAEKSGKALKAVPAALRKDAEYARLQDAKKLWRDQQSRIRDAMERAMIHGEVFDVSELAALAKNPAFAHFLNRLVFKAGDRLAYLDALVADRAKGGVFVAHPVHMREAGVWAELQKDVFDRRVVQPFKQVFRELYVPTREELRDGRQSGRYAMYRVAAKRAGGILKSRGWTMEYQGGFQRVYLRENVVARLDSFNTWAESPTLGDVSFCSRHGGFVALSDVPPVIFSEVMRDLDLAVSVAFLGDADPDASGSTVEMRLALAREAVRLFRLDNVTFKKTHAFIAGTRGDYTVHMGSGVMHQRAGGALDVRPVLERGRGKVFLPFADDDPRTAEIMTKILLFARDEQLKDPAILGQILNVKKQK